MPLKEPKATRETSGRGKEMELPLDQSQLPSTRWLKRFVVALIGGTVLVIGIAMIVLPGPALVVIPAGLAILATEFIWARRALRRCKGAVLKVKRKPWFRRIRRWAKSEPTSN